MFAFCLILSFCEVASDRALAHLDPAEGIGHLGVRGSALRLHRGDELSQLHAAQGDPVGLHRGKRLGHLDGGL